MSSISSIDTVRPPRSPSPASSPTLEDDIAQTSSRLTHGVDNTDVDRKGKSRQQHPDLTEQITDTNSYPPESDERAETRRVEETLRRWEITERQRRKAAREQGSSESIVASSSLLSDVTRRASRLWRSGSRKQNPSTGSFGGKHMALSSTDNIDTVPLEDIAASPTPTPSPSPSPTPSLSIPLPLGEGNSDIDYANNVKGNPHAAENPFQNPSTPSALEALSPFADAHRVDSNELRPPTDRLKTRAEKKRHSRPPPPMPLDLPRPKTPPSVPISTPPYPTGSANATQLSQDANGEVKPTRWWHEWLCGCGEGPDRGGDYQAGRTNPFE